MYGDKHIDTIKNKTIYFKLLYTKSFGNDYRKPCGLPSTH